MVGLCTLSRICLREFGATRDFSPLPISSEISKSLIDMQYFFTIVCISGGAWWMSYRLGAPPAAASLPGSAPYPLALLSVKL